MEDTLIFYFTLNIVSEFKTFFESLSKINDSDGMQITINFALKNDIPQMVISSLSADRTSLTFFDIGVNGINDFTKFYAKNNHTIGLDYTDIYQLSKLINDDCEVTFYITENDKNKLCVNITNTYKCIKYTMPIQNYNICNLPDIEADAVITMDIIELNKICDIASTFSKYADIKCTNEYIEIKPSINNCTSIKINTSRSTRILLQEHTSIVELTFEIKKVIAFSNMEKYIKNIEIYMSNDKPLFLKYILDNKTRIINCISPIKIHNDS